MTAALYAARSGKSVLVLEAQAFGGQIATAPRVENFPAVTEINGSVLADKMFEQAVSHGTEYDMGTASLKKNGDVFEVTTEYAEYSCKAVVLATGVSHKYLNVEGESKLRGKGVCYCAVCDGSFYKGKKVCVVGDGNSAAQYALYLAEICSSVSLLTMFGKLFCDRELTDRIVSCEKIEWIKNVTVREIVGDKKVEGISYSDDIGAITYLDTDAVFVAIGQEPHNEAFSGVVELDERGYIVAGEDCLTSCEGVFAAGDCRTKKIRQCVTAAGDGAVAGFSASMYADKSK